MKYFAEVKSPMGSWMPCVFDGVPPTQLPEGKKIRYRYEPVPVPVNMENLELSTIARILSPDGDLHRMPRPELLAFLNDPDAQILYWSENPQ